MLQNRSLCRTLPYLTQV